jgi:hypothetical protein
VGNRNGSLCVSTARAAHQNCYLHVSEIYLKISRLGASCLGQHRALQDGVAGEHVGELTLDLLRHHPHPLLLGHAPHHAQRKGGRTQRPGGPRGAGRRDGEKARRRQRAAHEHRRAIWEGDSVVSNIISCLSGLEMQQRIDPSCESSAQGPGAQVLHHPSKAHSS